MNASRLREIIDLLLEREKDNKIQELLGDVAGKLSNLVSQPQQQQHQQEFAQAAERLRVAMQALTSAFEPSQVALIEEIAAGGYFTADIPADIEKWIRENPITPTVAHQRLQKLVEARATFLGRLGQLRENLDKLGIKATALAPGTAEIGFMIPRSLFKNQLDQLIKELGAILRIVRAFSELTTGSAEIVQVRQISSSDPLFFFNLGANTIAALGNATTWALNTWKTVADIRRVRTEATKVAAFTDADVAEMFDKKIKTTIEDAIEKKVQELAGAGDGKSGRKHEQRTDISWALESILARVERGMTVEIRFLPPPTPKSGTTAEAYPAVARTFDDLKVVTPQLVFPKVEGEPVLKLPAPEPAKASKRDSS